MDDIIHHFRVFFTYSFFFRYKKTVIFLRAFEVFQKRKLEFSQKIHGEKNIKVLNFKSKLKGKVIALK